MNAQHVDGPYFEALIPPVPAVGGIDMVAAAHKTFGDVVTEYEAWTYQGKRLCARLEEATAQMLEAGSRVEPVLDPEAEAFLVAWQANRQGEAPIGRPIP